MLSSKHTWQKESVPVSVSSLQTLQMLSSFRSMFTKCSSSSMVFLQSKQNKQLFNQFLSHWSFYWYWYICNGQSIATNQIPLIMFQPWYFYFCINGWFKIKFPVKDYTISKNAEKVFAPYKQCNIKIRRKTCSDTIRLTKQMRKHSEHNGC